MRPFALLLLAGAGVFAADELPAWVKEAAAKQAPAYPAKTPAVVLFQEETLSVDTEGRRVMTERAVIRKLSTGRVPLVASRAYNVKSGRIRDIRAWVISPAGKETRYGKDRVVDTVAGSGNDYDEARVKSITPGEDWQTGGIFAYEIVEEEKTLFTQHTYNFQTNLPVLHSRFTLNIPGSWEAKGHIINGLETGAYNNNGGVHIWELRNLPWFDDEEYSPEWHELAPRLAITYFPSDGRAGLRPLRDWAAVSAWMSALSDSQSQATPAIQAKAAQLTANAPTPLDKVRAVAAFVQQTNYISVQMNLTRGGGYTPHRADDVLTKNYGDCKDKANLMKALLAAAGIDSHLVSIFSRARGFVRPEWPSTLQFNHMILAVRAPAGIDLPTLTTHAALGRLLFFDPTDPYTAVGDLPDEEQGSYALVIAGDKGDLIRVPRVPAAANRTVSETTAVMGLDGGVTAKSRRQYFGQSASGLRALIRRSDEPALRRRFERVLTRRLGGLNLKTLQPADNPTAGHLDLTLEFTALQLGKLMQNRLLVVAPGALLSGGTYAMPVMQRKLPVKLEAQVQQDRVTIQIPDGFQVDELPDPVHLKSKFGEFRAKWKAATNNLEMEQNLEVFDATIPATEYALVRSFFEQVGGAANAAAVLVKK
ncbi:MAG: DUF3857 domain-containing protein [Acidobacteria bacterium]|nr:DUF3857 domain-containing protein [Acidobacteriota bacterium]